MLSTGITPILGIVTAAVSTSETSKKEEKTYYEPQKLYLLNFIDYGDETNQEQMLVKTNLSKKEVSDIVEKIIEESKKLWNEEDEQYSDFSLSEIVVKKLKETFGKENVLQFEYLKFYW
jgi:hypothetical protein